MLGNVYRSGRRRTASIPLGGLAAVALGLALLLGGASSAYAKPRAAHVPRGRPAVVIATSHPPAAKHPAKAHAAGHKIA